MNFNIWLSQHSDLPSNYANNIANCLKIIHKVTFRNFRYVFMPVKLLRWLRFPLVRCRKKGRIHSGFAYNIRNHLLQQIL